MEKVLVVLLTYYGTYTLGAVAAMRRWMASTGLHCELVVVATGTAQPVARTLTACRVLEGNNEWGEFGGWQVALEDAKVNGGLDRFAGVVLANDTLCHHNQFGPITRHLFAKALRRMVQSDQPKAAGARQAFSGRFEVDGVSGTAWLSSYLVLVNKAAAMALDPLVPVLPSIPSTPAEAFEHLGANEVLKKHVSHWYGLTPARPGAPRWYGADLYQGPEHTLRLAGRVTAALLEFRLAARLAQRNGQLLDVFDTHLVWRQLRRLEPRPKAGRQPR